MSPAAATVPVSLSQHLSRISERVCQAIAAHLARDRALAPVLFLAMTRLHHLSARIQRLVANLRAGRPAPIPPTCRLQPLPRFPSLPRTLVLPRRHGWLVQLVPAASVYAAELDRLLADPETAALLAIAPQAQRLLRPLRRMLGLRLARPAPSDPAPPPHPLPPPPCNPGRPRAPTLTLPRQPETQS